MRIAFFILSLLFSIIFSIDAIAETTAWWHFDEEDAGYAFNTVASNIITNEYGSPTSYAETYSFAGETSTGPADYYPRYEKPFRGLCVYDPVSGQKRVNRSSLRFTVGNDGSENGGRAYYGGCVAIPGDLAGDATSPTDAITIECFVCTTGGVFNTFAPIFGKRRNNNGKTDKGWTAEAWALYMTANGSLSARLNTVDANGNVTSKHAGTTGNGTAINDGSWHHVAYTFDKSIGKAVVYVDYTNSFELAANAVGESLSYGTDTTYTGIYVGGYGYCPSANGGLRFPGLIDELRISNTVLSPDQFLRLQPLDMDDDTVLRISFDPDAYTSELLPYANLSDHTYGVRALYRKPSGGAATFDTTDKAGSEIGERVFADGTANAASFSIATNAAGVSAFVQASALSDALGGTDVDFTIEMFFKTRGRVTGTEDNNQTIFKFSSTPYAQAIFRANMASPFCFAFKDSNQKWSRTEPQLAGMDNGEWHHVAFVNDSTNKQVRGYLDHALVSVSNNVGILAASVSSTLYIGRSNTTPYQYFDGWIDDCRVTKRALRPEEFLTTHPVGAAAASDTLLVAKFDDSLGLEGAAPSLSVAGDGNAFEGGTAPFYSNITPGAILFDGTNGAVRTENVKSIQFDHGYVVYPDSVLYEQKAITVEMFAKVTAISGQYNNLFRLADNSSNLLAAPVWSLYCEDGDSKIRSRIRTVENGVSGDKYTTATSLGRPFADGKWHHYALTLEPSDTTNTQISVYCDYRLVSQNVFGGTLNYATGTLGGHRIIVGTTRADRKVAGYFDTLRISRGVLPVERFMGRGRKGLVVCFW